MILSADRLLIHGDPMRKKKPLVRISNTPAAVAATEKSPTADSDPIDARKTLSRKRVKKAKMLSPKSGHEYLRRFLIGVRETAAGLM